MRRLEVAGVKRGRWLGVSVSMVGYLGSLRRGFGRASQQLDLLDPVARFYEETLPPNSIYAFLHRAWGHAKS